MKKNEMSNPVDIGFLGFQAVMAGSQLGSDLLNKGGLVHDNQLQFIAVWMNSYKWSPQYFQLWVS